jgi:hypothetical protein
MSVTKQKAGVRRLSPGAVIKAVRKTTELSLRRSVQQADEGGESVPHVARRRSRAGIKSVTKITELPLD